MAAVLRLTYFLRILPEFAPKQSLRLGSDFLDEALDDVVTELVLGQGY